ncbi:MAG: hypothetical protein U9Q99_00365 [Nanoarchaeota archaeon]|nr:hypothetical protein [Nanoarchaeota archaeon]
MVINIFQIISILGLILIILGSYFSLKRKTRIKFTYLAFILGGICLLIYSIYIKDLIFIILQGVFVIVAILEYYMSHKK